MSWNHGIQYPMKPDRGWVGGEQVQLPPPSISSSVFFFWSESLSSALRTPLPPHSATFMFLITPVMALTLWIYIGICKEDAALKHLACHLSKSSSWEWKREGGESSLCHTPCLGTKTRCQVNLCLQKKESGKKRQEQTSVHVWVVVVKVTIMATTAYAETTFAHRWRFRSSSIS